MSYTQVKYVALAIGISCKSPTDLVYATVTNMRRMPTTEDAIALPSDETKLPIVVLRKQFSAKGE